MKVLMCRPDFYDVVYKINPWMIKMHSVTQKTAIQQWEQLHNTIQQCGAEVALVKPVPEQPDIVFTANAGLIFGNSVYLANFRYPERQGERKYYQEWFESEQLKICGNDPSDYHEGVYSGPCFEGAGDGLFAGDTLFAAYGFRSDKSVYSRFSDLGIKNIVLCELVDPYFYHLDTCFCPLNESHAIWWPGAFSDASQQRLTNSITLHAVPENEARFFACNAVVLQNHVIIPAECPKTAAILEQLGFTVHSCPMTEFIKAGGACKCLTLVVRN